ncbi:single-stranded DNA-binding protein [Bacillus velezensis]|uniref:single-stranded DNA-binding protein n=1 Tax=Bacillus velezensis TaxID=492670 RepID=UPI003F7C0653
MYSHVNLIGRITNEIKLETTSSGKPKVFFYIAVSKPMDRKESFTPAVIAYNADALNMVQQNVNKGDLVCVEGFLDGYQEGRKTMVYVLARRIVYLEPHDTREKRHIEQGIKLPNHPKQYYDASHRAQGYEEHRPSEYGYSSDSGYTYGNRNQSQWDRRNRRDSHNQDFSDYRNDNKRDRNYGGKRQRGKQDYRPDDDLPF